jgi:D-xylose transport system permease protein
MTPETNPQEGSSVTLQFGRDHEGPSGQAIGRVPGGGEHQAAQRAKGGGRAAGWLSAVMARGTAVPAVLSLLVIAVFFQSQSHYFLSAGNLSNLLVETSLLVPIALAEVGVLLLAEIDLSLGSLVGATAAILGVMLSSVGLPWWAAVLVTLACGAAMGAFQGLWIALVRIPSFVVTLGGWLGFLGLQLYILGPQGTMSVFDPNIAALTGSHVAVKVGWVVGGIVAVALISVALVRWRAAGSSRRLGSLGLPVLTAALIIGVVALLNAYQGVPTAFVVVIGLLLLGWWVTEHTRPGRNLFAIGGNPEPARRAGISVKRIRFMAFVTAGTLGAVGGLMAASYNSSAGTLTGGGTLLLEAIGAAVIGGTSLFGGQGTVWAALFGSLIMAGIGNGLDLTNRSQPVKYMVQGIVVLLAVTLDTLLRRRALRGRRLGGITMSARAD